MSKFPKKAGAPYRAHPSLAQMRQRQKPAPAARVISPSVAAISRERARAEQGLPPIKPSGIADQIRRELELEDKQDTLQQKMREAQMTLNERRALQAMDDE